jgi:hypothetical protein
MPTHLHTAYSADAGLVGATTTPDDAFRFAKGEVVISSNGLPARLQRPLDWLVVTDHAENLGIPIALEEQNPALEQNEWGRTLAETFAPRTEDARLEAYIQWFGAVNDPDGSDPMAGTDFGRTMWERATQAAEDHNVSGSFTAMIGFEWTSGPDGNNLHRNVIFRDGKELADQIVPISAYDSDDPEVLWAWMADYEASTGGQLLAIPHNGNLSNGLMFDDVTLSGEPHPLLSPTGTRMRVRVFGGWDFAESDLVRSDFAAHGYDNGVPMGGDLADAPAGGAPSFLVRALRDPDGANLDRVQIIKGWTTADGETQERVYDAAWSDGRVPGADGRLPPVGNTVDIEAASYTNAIGEPFLEAFWQDPDFDPEQRAFYYVRVLEIPTPSWLVYDAAALGVELPEGKTLVQQERAYTSPIWYTP